MKFFKEPRINEGWGIPHDARKRHYMINGRSLCGKYEYYYGKCDLPEDRYDKDFSCKACRDLVDTWEKQRAEMRKINLDELIDATDMEPEQIDELIENCQSFKHFHDTDASDVSGRNWTVNLYRRSLNDEVYKTYKRIYFFIWIEEANPEKWSAVGVTRYVKGKRRSSMNKRLWRQGDIHNVHMYLSEIKEIFEFLMRENLQLEIPKALIKKIVE